MSALTLISRNKMFNGSHERYRHFSDTNRCEMVFSVYLPPQALRGYRVPVLYWLSDLNCTDEDFSIKSGAPRFAAYWGIALVISDTSPRREGVADDAAHGLAQGTGFYSDAAREPWTANYQMYSYVVHELPALIEAYFPVNGQRSIAGCGMGGYGALQIALKNPDHYAAVSAFVPIDNPSQTPWVQRACAAYLGGNPESRTQYDCTELVKTASKKLPVLIDQGSADEFDSNRLQSQSFVNAARGNGFNVHFNLREGYGYSDYFIATFIDSHIEFHADALEL